MIKHLFSEYGQKKSQYQRIVELYARKGDPRARAILEKGRERGMNKCKTNSENDTSNSDHDSADVQNSKRGAKKKKRTNY
jgi:hypothetical protein